MGLKGALEELVTWTDRQGCQQGRVSDENPLMWQRRGALHAPDGAAPQQEPGTGPDSQAGAGPL